MKFLFNPYDFFFGVAAIAWGIGFARYFGHWVYFPVFPNVLDSAGLMLMGAYLLYRTLRERRVKA